MRFSHLHRTDWWPLLSGAASVAFAYPPFHLLLPSFVCLAPGVWLIHTATLSAAPFRRALSQGFWFGLVSNALVLHWMPVALWRYTPFAVAAYAGAMLGFGAYTAVMFALTAWITRVVRMPMVLVFPTLWTALEWICGHHGILTFPWLGLGTSLTGYPVLIQIAEVVGARGVTWLLAAANVALATAWIERRRPKRSLALTAAVAAGAAVAVGFGRWRELTVPLNRAGTVAMVQPNVGYLDKWDPGKQDSIVAALIGLSTEAASEIRPAFIVWPESAIPGYFAYRPDWESMVAEHARRSHAPILVGALDIGRMSDSTHGYYNTALQFDPGATGARFEQASYRKRKTVLFIEQFSGIRAGVSSPLLQNALGTYGVLICYESAFEALTRDYRRLGADFVVNISNDAWLGGTGAPYQHAAHVVMRAVENRIGILRVANNGVSMFVDPLGRVHSRTDFGTRTYAAANILTSNLEPLYTNLGDWVGLLSVAAAGGLCVCSAAVAIGRSRGALLGLDSRP